MSQELADYSGIGRILQNYSGIAEFITCYEINRLLQNWLVILWNCSAIVESVLYCWIFRLMEFVGYCRIDQLFWNSSAIVELIINCEIAWLLLNWSPIVKLFGYCWIGRLLWNMYCLQTCSTTSDEIVWNRIFVTV